MTETSTMRKFIYLTNNNRTSLVTYSFSIFIALSLISLIMNGYILTLLNNTTQLATEQSKETFVNFIGYFDIINRWSYIVYLICGIIFSFWIYRANNNIHALNTNEKIKFTPWLSVASFFIPFLNLYWPYKAMKEIWINSKKIQMEKVSSIILTWWLTFLLFLFSTNIYPRIAINTTSGIKNYIIINATAHIFGIIAAFIAIKIVKEINKSQNNL